VGDGIVLMELGLPVVVVVQQAFEQAAVTQATLLGGPTLPICAYRDPRPEDTEESDHERARTAADGIVSLLAARTEEN